MVEILARTLLISWMAVAFILPGGVDRALPGLIEWRIDGFDGLSVPLTLGEDTVYADGYSAERWDRVAVGMTRSEVRTLLGEPLRSFGSDSGSISWERWTYSPGDTHYRIRVVSYRDDRVLEKHGSFYYD